MGGPCCPQKRSGHRGKSMRGYREKMGIYKPKTEASGDGNAANALIFHFQPPELGENTFLWFKSPRLSQPWLTNTGSWSAEPPRPLLLFSLSEGQSLHNIHPWLAQGTESNFCLKQKKTKTKNMVSVCSRSPLSCNFNRIPCFSRKLSPNFSVLLMNYLLPHLDCGVIVPGAQSGSSDSPFHS